MSNQRTAECFSGSLLTGSPDQFCVVKTTVRKPLGDSTPQAPWMTWATRSAAGSTTRPVSSRSSRAAVSVTGSPGSLLPMGRSHLP